jgi:hypothetical protein
MNLQDILQLFMMQQAQQQPPANPSYAAQQVAGQGVLGQGLQNQAQQIDQMTGGQPAPPQTLGEMAAQQPMAQVPPSPKVRQGWQNLDPRDMTPEELALFQAMHNIQPPPTAMQQSQAMLKQIMQMLGQKANAGPNQ